jgi:hypothetical protein
MKRAIAQAKIKEKPLKRGETDDSPQTPLQQRGICKGAGMRFISSKSALKSRETIVVRFWRSRIYIAV